MNMDAKIQNLTFRERLSSIYAGIGLGFIQAITQVLRESIILIIPAILEDLDTIQKNQQNKSGLYVVFMYGTLCVGNGISPFFMNYFTKTFRIIPLFITINMASLTIFFLTSYARNIYIFGFMRFLLGLTLQNGFINMQILGPVLKAQPSKDTTRKVLRIISMIFIYAVGIITGVFYTSFSGYPKSKQVLYFYSAISIMFMSMFLVAVHFFYINFDQVKKIQPQLYLKKDQQLEEERTHLSIKQSIDEEKENVQKFTEKKKLLDKLNKQFGYRNIFLVMFSGSLIHSFQLTYLITKNLFAVLPRSQGGLGLTITQTGVIQLLSVLVFIPFIFCYSGNAIFKGRFKIQQLTLMIVMLLMVGLTPVIQILQNKSSIKGEQDLTMLYLLMIEGVIYFATNEVIQVNVEYCSTAFICDSIKGTYIAYMGSSKYAMQTITLSCFSALFSVLIQTQTTLGILGSFLLTSGSIVIILICSLCAFSEKLESENAEIKKEFSDWMLNNKGNE